MVRIFRLIATAPGRFSHNEIRGMVNGDRLGFGSYAFWNDVVTIVGIASSADWGASAVAHLADEGRRSAVAPFLKLTAECLDMAFAQRAAHDQRLIQLQKDQQTRSARKFEVNAGYHHLLRVSGRNTSHVSEASRFAS